MQKFIDFLPVENIVELTSATKSGALTELIALATQRCSLPAEDIFASIMARENVMSTALGEALAIPHGRVAKLGQPLLILGRCANPISDYVGMDNKPVQLILLILLDFEDTQKHLEILQSVASVLLASGATEKVLAVNNSNDCLDLLGRLSLVK